MAAPSPALSTDIPALLRFLTQDAKLPLSKAMASVKPLQAASLHSPSSLAASNASTLTPIFDSHDDAKRVLSAAKRVTKRGASTAPPTPTRGKKRKFSPTNDAPTPLELEDSLSLPDPIKDVDRLRRTVLYTNRAPLLLAFAVVLIKHTLPGQPLSSRLSLAQGMVSQGAREKAVYLGLEKGLSAEEEGFGMGQPVVKVMSRDVRVLKRWGYEIEESLEAVSNESGAIERDLEADAESEEVKPDETVGDGDNVSNVEKLPALWALDLEALKKSNASTGESTAKSHGKVGVGLPIYTPQSARSYLLRSFASAKTAENDSGAKQTAGKKAVEEKEENLGMLLGAVDLLYESWTETLGPDELNRRASSWYAAVRPDVDKGVAGWGGKGEVRLARILDLRKQ